MGSQIALQAAFNGFDTWVVGRWSSSLERSLTQIHATLHDMQKSNEASDELINATISRLHLTLRPSEGLEAADLCIEAVPETVEMKREIFRQMDEYCPKHAILATSSATIRVVEFEKVLERSDRVLNMLFYPPIWRRPLVELMRGARTSDETVGKVSDFARRAGLNPLTVLKESKDFAFGAVWRAIRHESLRVVDRGICTMEDIDRAWMVVTGMKIGPFGIMDETGLDVVREVEIMYYVASKDPRDAPPKLLLDRIEIGSLGVKSGKGFYTYPNPAFRERYWVKGSVPSEPVLPGPRVGQA